MSNQPKDKNSRYAGMAHANADRSDLSSEKFEDYRAHIEEFDLSENEQREFLRALQDIADSFVQMGWEGSDAIAPASNHREGGGA